MIKPLNELYIEWLVSQIAIEYNKPTDRTYWELLRRMNTEEFVWIVPNDDNRIADGWDLRREFLNYVASSADPEWLGLGISVLEVLIGVSRRIAFNADGSAEGWAWQLIENLELHEYDDPVSGQENEHIDRVLKQLIWRQYKRDGWGGFFPLMNPANDQRDVEIWYQMSAYINALGP